MKRNLIIIKLGGSVITDKTKTVGVFKSKVFKRLAQEIKSAKDKGEFNLILIHGAGSFAHPIAKKYRLNEGYLGPKSSEGFILTKRGVLALNLLVWQELAKAGLKSATVESSAVIKAAQGKILELDTDFIESLLNKDVIPVLSGDVVVDKKMGFSIISGDQITAFLARSLRAKKVVFISDVDGVFDKDPTRYKDAKIIPEINTSNYQNILKKMKTKNPSDVTGEMKGKILSIKKNLRGIKVLIINGLKRGNVLKSLDIYSNQELGTALKF